MTIEQPEVKNLDVEQIHPNPWNPNEMDEEKFEQLKEDMKDKGYLQFILARPSKDNEGMYEIVDGEHRWRAAREAGVDSLKTIVADIPDDNEARKTTLNMNDIKGTDNPVELAKVLDELREEESIEQLEQDLVMSSEEIKQHEMLLDLPDEEDIADELDEAINEDEEDELEKVEISFEIKPDQAEELCEEFSCEQDELADEIRKFALDQIM